MLILVKRVHILVSQYCHNVLLYWVCHFYSCLILLLIGLHCKFRSMMVERVVHKCRAWINLVFCCQTQIRLPYNRQNLSQCLILTCVCMPGHVCLLATTLGDARGHPQAKSRVKCLDPQCNSRSSSSSSSSVFKVRLRVCLCKRVILRNVVWNHLKGVKRG